MPTSSERSVTSVRIFNITSRLQFTIEFDFVLFCGAKKFLDFQFHISYGVYN